MTGTIRKVKGRDDYWRAYLLVRGKRYSATGDSQEKAWKSLQDKIAKDGRKVLGVVDPLTIRVDEYVGEWLERRKLEIGRGLEARSWGNLERAANLHLLPAIGDLALAELTARHLEALYAKLMGPPSCLSIKTVRDINGTLRVALKRLPRDFGVPNPAMDVDLPRRERISVQYPLLPDQMRRFWRVAEHDRLYALWLLASYFPTRSGELRGVRWTDVDWANETLALQRSLQSSGDGGRVLHMKEGGKTDSNSRVLELDARLLAALLEHQKRQDEERRAAGSEWVEHGLIFTARYGTPILSVNLLRRFRRLLHLARVPEHHRVHDLRHTAVQNLLLSGVSLVEASGAAGHASPAVTSALYAHSVRRVKRGLVAHLDSFYRGTGDVEVIVDAPLVLAADGQRRALTPAQLTEAKRLRGEGATQAALAARFGVSVSTINRALRGVSGRGRAASRD